MKLDGGAMFGIVPRSLWQRQYPADENNMIGISMRSLLVVEGDRKVLFDNGIGDKQDHKFFSYYYLFGEDTLEKSLAGMGLGPEDITDMVLTHLHFDHCGGSIRFSEDRSELLPVFPNAQYWVSRPQWDLAQDPNKLEGASFLKENIDPIKASGQLELFEGEFDLSPNIRLRLFDGHTMGQAVALIHSNGKTLVNIADLIPLVGNISMSWVCGYDTRPLVTLAEKADFLKESLAGGYIYYFYHDLEHECAILKDTMKGIRAERTFPLSEASGSF